MFKKNGKWNQLNYCSANPFKPLRQAVSWDRDTPNAMTTAPQRAMSVDTNSTNSNETNRCSNISDESGPITTPAAPISSSSSEHDNHEAGAWSSDYSNSEDEYPNAEDTAPVRIFWFRLFIRKHIFYHLKPISDQKCSDKKKCFGKYWNCILIFNRNSNFLFREKSKFSNVLFFKLISFTW